jgi:hypothetical protein
MRLKLSLKNSIKPALLFCSLLVPIFLYGCSTRIEPTYKEKDIPYLVKNICKDEYNLDVVTQRTGSTLWIYAPLQKILHEDYGVNKDKIFDEGMVEKLRNILTTIGRVLISSDNTPEFYALVASDVNLGLDYAIIGNALDIKKSYSGFLPWTEANRRYLLRLRMSPEAIGDQTGYHVEAYDIQLPEFLAEQISQRIGAEFQDENMKKYFQVEKSDGIFSDNAFYFEYSIKQIAKPEKEIDVRKRVLDIITYCIKSYEFKDFSEVVLTDLLTQDKLNLNQGAIWGRPLLN